MNNFWKLGSPAQHPLRVVAACFTACTQKEVLAGAPKSNEDKIPSSVGPKESR